MKSKEGAVDYHEAPLWLAPGRTFWKFGVFRLSKVTFSEFSAEIANFERPWQSRSIPLRIWSIKHPHSRWQSNLFYV